MRRRFSVALPGIPRAVIGGLAALGILIAVHSVLAVRDDAFAGWLAAITPLLALAVIAERVRRVQAERTAWGLVTLVMALSTVSGAYLAVIHPEATTLAAPSAADLGFLATYPLLLVALGLLARERVAGFRASLWIDGVIGSLTVAAVGAAFLYSPSSGQAHETRLAAAMLLAYVLGDLLLIAAIVGTFALFAWRPGAAWVAIAGGVGVMSVADLLQIRLSDGGSHPSPGLVTTLGLIAVGVAALASWLQPAKRHATITGWRVQAFPIMFVSVAFALLTYDFVADVNPLARILITCALAAAMLRLVLTAHENRALQSTKALAVTDELTGLPNRRLLVRRLEESCRSELPFSLLMLDLDGFKEVNDALGHTAGDDLLRQIGERIGTGLHPDGLLARLGGDEFAIIVTRGGTGTALAIAEAVAVLLQDPFHVSGIALRIAASVGIVEAPVHGSQPYDLLRRADIAMYRAKNARSGHDVYEPRDDEWGPGQLALVEELRAAIEHAELHVYYQPKADTASGEVIGLEALVRWQHPTRGLLSPAEFLPIVDQAGLMHALTLVVLERALRDVFRLRARFPALTVGINVSIETLLSADLPREVEGLLTAAKLPASALEIEITEEALMTDPLRTRNLVAQLRRLGVVVAIDDYGTGYSSLQFVRDLAVDWLKLDRSFVTGLSEHGPTSRIVESTIDLAHALGLGVVAEGVETEHDRATLQSLGCDVIQGYLLTSPLPLDAITEWMAARGCDARDGEARAA